VLGNKLLFVFIIGYELVEFLDQLSVILHSELLPISLYLACCSDYRSTSLAAAEERNHRSSGMAGVSVFDELQNRPDMARPSVLYHRFLSSFHSPGFAVILLKIFTLSVRRKDMASYCRCRAMPPKG